MNQEIRNRFEEKWERRHRGGRKGRVLSGLLLLAVGGVLLLRTMDLLWMPGWVFTWPMILIGVGILSGIKHGFRGGFWMIMILMGGLFLANEIDQSLNLEKYAGPIAIIAVGLVFILRPKGRFSSRQHRYGNFMHHDDDDNSGTQNFTEPSFNKTDFIEITSVFGGVKKNVLTKNFKGGDIVSFMGGSEINLMQADFKGRVKIDVTNILGGTKLFIPSSWDVQSDVTAILGGVEDKRKVSGVATDPDKVLVLDGVCLLGGIEIRSY